mmetsp:Transcript_8387/g.23536  ORF Transcript_8387/g.23536 Transcript_8387/m.23536 type:complete len:238 (-) Transcript_8387:601-1314(-)
MSRMSSSPLLPGHHSGHSQPRVNSCGRWAFGKYEGLTGGHATSGAGTTAESSRPRARCAARASDQLCQLLRHWARSSSQHRTAGSSAKRRARSSCSRNLVRTSSGVMAAFTRSSRGTRWSVAARWLRRPAPGVAGSGAALFSSRPTCSFSRRSQRFAILSRTSRRCALILRHHCCILTTRCANCFKATKVRPATLHSFKHATMQRASKRFRWRRNMYCARVANSPSFLTVSGSCFNP